MKINKIVFIFALAIILSACGSKNTTTNEAGSPKSAATKLLINELPIKDRPFVTFVPHITNRLFTFVGLNMDKATESTLDVEYQSGDLLKGVKANVDSPIPNTFVKAIILGSCSTGGKCSFDKDLKSGTIKLKLKYPSAEAIHLLKGDFTFTLGQTNLPDGKVTFTPLKPSIKENLILSNSFGLPKVFDKEVLLYPIVISAVNDKIISGDLSVSASGATEAYIYDGTTYQPLKISNKDGKVQISINQKPWTMKAEIIRDDEKGSKESITLYILGPVVLSK